MGMGIAEVAVVLVVAFLVLGPGRTIDAARSTGRLIGDLRRNFAEVMEAINLEREQQAGAAGPGVHGRRPGAAGAFVAGPVEGRPAGMRGKPGLREPSAGPPSSHVAGLTSGLLP